MRKGEVGELVELVATDRDTRDFGLVLGHSLVNDNVMCILTADGRITYKGISWIRLVERAAE